MIETEHFGKLREAIGGRVFYWKINANFAPGVPDAYLSGTKDDLWCEGKRFPTLPPVVDLTNPNITTLQQQAWLTARHAEGRKVAMLVFTDKQGCLLLPGLEWQKPIPRDEFLARAKTRTEIADELHALLGDSKDHDAVQSTLCVRRKARRRPDARRRRQRR